MRNARHAGAAVEDEQRVQTQRALGAMLVPLFFVAAFAACIIGSYHKPHPDGIRLGVAGPPRVTAPLRARLATASGSAFDISAVPTVARATQAVRDRDLNAAFVPTADPKRPATVIVAGANGRIVAVASETLARAVTTAQGAQLAVRDVRPLVSGDALGLGVFMFLLVCTIVGYIAPTILETAAPALTPRRRYLILAGTATLVATIAYLIGGLGFGAYEGSFGTILAFIAVGALYGFIVGMGTRLFQVLIGLPAIFVSLAIFVFLNIASLGATYTPPVMAPLWRFLNHFWIGAGAVDAERSLLYFGGDGVATDLLRVLAWVVVIGALLVLPVSRRLERERERADDRGPEAAVVGAAV
jgi:hypothetical protein